MAKMWFYVSFSPEHKFNPFVVKDRISMNFSVLANFGLKIKAASLDFQFFEEKNLRSQWYFLVLGIFKKKQLFLYFAIEIYTLPDPKIVNGELVFYNFSCLLNLVWRQFQIFWWKPIRSLAANIYNFRRQFIEP